MQEQVGVERGFSPAPRTAEPGVRARRRRGWVWLLLLLGAAAVIAWFTVPRFHKKSGTASNPRAGAGAAAAGPVPVIAGTARAQDVPIYLDGLGTVQAFNTVSVRPRVDGQVQRILFSEGQDVKAGDLIVQIDPAPFQAQLGQVVAKKAEDDAQLAVAKVNLQRNTELLAQKILAQQDYDTQRALVQQLEATLQADQAAIDNAKVQLAYTQITSPLDGRVGIRQIDQGNLVHANDPNPIVTITQLRPISVVFTLAEQYLGDIQRHAHSSEPLEVLALDRNNREALDHGQLAVVDNQIDTSTGTIRLKATFPNADLRLWPGQFVNARLLLTVHKGGTVVPAQVIQRGPDGPYAFIIQPDDTVAVRPVKVAQIEDGQALIEEGLRPGDRVVVDGQYKLRPNSKVKTSDAPPQGATPGGARRAAPSPAKAP